MRIDNVADLIAETLVQAGVKRIFGVVGDSLNGLTEALRKRKTIDWIHVRHEEVAAFAAAGEAQITGELAVCAGSCGPGNLHLINGLFDAHRSRTPVLAIAAQIPSGRDRRRLFPGDPSAGTCSGNAATIANWSPIRRSCLTCWKTPSARRWASAASRSSSSPAMSRCGRRPSAASHRMPGCCRRRPIVRPAEPELKALAEALNGAKRITLFCGRGCAGAHDSLMQLAETLKSPIVHALGGKEYVEYDNPYDVGMTGFIGFSSGYAAMHACDVLLMLGTDFPYKQFLPTDAKIAQVDIRPENLGRRCKLDLGLVGDVGATIEALLPKLKAKTERKHLDDSRRALQESARGAGRTGAGHAGPQADPSAIPGAPAQRASSDDAVFTADVGTPTIWAARYLAMNGRRRLVGSWVHGSMANAMAHAIGAQAAQPGRQVISMSGDGGFAMLMGDLITLTQMKLPVKVVIFNNGVLGFVALEMKAAGFVETGSICKIRISPPWRAPWASMRVGSRIPANCRTRSATCWPMTARRCSTS